ncbi:MAG: hypothetical protein II956_02540 [Bacteroidales bacterium]|nr:hypothetical protein [Bacteroidales bacterium]
MKKILYCAALLFAFYGCNNTENDIKTLNVFFTDLSEVYTNEFNGPDADDVTKIDFAVKKMLNKNPEMFTPSGKRSYGIDTAKVHATVLQYFSYPVKKPQNTVDVDLTSDGKYEILKAVSNEKVFSRVEKIVAERNDTLLLDVNVYSGEEGAEPALYKKMRSVVVRKDDGFRIVSYTPSK